MFTFIVSNAAVWQNGAGGTYCDGDSSENCDERAPRTPYSIESLVEEGAGYFLLSNSYLSSIAYIVEMSNLDGIDIEKLNACVNSALDNIILAGHTYDMLIEMALETPYDSVRSDLLKNFDYESFRKELSLNSEIFQDVTFYLKTGDVTGTFLYVREKLKRMEKLLQTVKYYAETGKLPAISIIWQLNEVSAKTLLFGQYAAYTYSAAY